MSVSSLETRRLELSPGEKGLISGLSIAAFLILALLGCWAYHRNKAKRDAMRQPPEPEKEIPIEIHEESTQDSKDDVEVAITESKSSEDSYDKSISMCRSGTMNSLDVHTCASGSCVLCRKNQEPNFVGVKKVEPGTEGRIRSLPDRWWENPLSITKRPEVMQTIVSHSRSDESWGEEEPAGEDGDTLGGDTLGGDTLVLEDGIVRD
jgi:hypothetical protein